MQFSLLLGSYGLTSKHVLPARFADWASLQPIEISVILAIMISVFPVVYC